MHDFYVRLPSGRTEGPFTAAEVSALAASGRIPPLGFVARVPHDEGYLRRDFVPVSPPTLRALRLEPSEAA